jgi:hypothetical protein
LAGTIGFREVVTECFSFMDLFGVGVIELNPLSEYVEKGYPQVPIFRWITQ